MRLLDEIAGKRAVNDSVLLEDDVILTVAERDLLVAAVREAARVVDNCMGGKPLLLSGLDQALEPLLEENDGV